MSTLEEYVGLGAVATPKDFRRPREKYILLNCVALLEARIQTFREWREDADQLASYVGESSRFCLLDRLTRIRLMCNVP